MKKTAMVILGNIILAFSMQVFIISNNFLAGGISGIGKILNYYFGLPITASVAAMNIMIFFLGFLVFGWKFSARSLLSTILFPSFFALFEKVTVFRSISDDLLLVSLLAGVLNGFALGLILRSDASSGGLDTLALIVNKYFHFPISSVMSVMDIANLILQSPAQDFRKIIYGLTVMAIQYFVMNYTITKGRSLIQFLIISDSYSTIREKLLNHQDAGVTLIETVKGYSMAASKAILCVVPNQKMASVKKEVLSVDPAAFIIVSRIDEVGGNGFTYSLRD